MATVDFFKHNNKNTTSATNTRFRHYERWATETNRPSNLLSMEKLELNAVLESYFAEAVRKDGKQYEPTSLGAMQAGIDRYLRENGSTFLVCCRRNNMNNLRVKDCLRLLLFSTVAR